MTAGRRPQSRRPWRARSTQPHRGRPMFSSACPYSLPCPTSASLAPFALSRTRADGHGALVARARAGAASGCPLASASVLLGFDDVFVSELWASGEFGDHLLRGCLEEVEARLVGRD